MSHWDERAIRHGTHYRASWDDVFAVNLEIDAIRPWLSDARRVLDAGCGNGYALMKHIGRLPDVEFTGIDLSHPMIEAARSRRSAAKFFAKDVRSTGFNDGEFDVSYTTRCLINLPGWDEQRRAIHELLRVSRRRVVLSEAFWEPLCRLNSIRQTAGLEPLVEHDFNRYLKESRLRRELEDSGVKYKVVSFSSLYYLGSRFIRDLISKKNEPYENPVNEMFAAFESQKDGGDFGVQKLYALEK